MERDDLFAGQGGFGLISIHALRMERDGLDEASDFFVIYFNPRAPHGARPGGAPGAGRDDPISIHALRMERDVTSFRPYR